MNRCTVSSVRHAPGGPSGRVVQDAAAADRGELVPVTDERDPGAGLVGDVEQRPGGVLVEHPGLIDQQQVAGQQPRAAIGLRTCSRVQRPSSSHR